MRTPRPPIGRAAAIHATLCAAAILAIPCPAVAARPAPLPDSVIAVVGDRTVTRADYARARAEDPSSAATDPSVTVGRLVDRAAILEAALERPLAWSAADSASFRTSSDRMILSVVLDEVLARARRDVQAHGDSANDDRTLGIAAREAAVAGVAPAYDDSLLARLARAWGALPRPSPDSTIAAQLAVLSREPEIPAGDLARTLVRSNVGEVPVREVVASWTRLPPALRPRIETPEQVRDLAENALFERVLRHEAAAAGVAQRPDVAAALDAEREARAIRAYLDREVLADLEADPSEVRRSYDANPGAWAVPAGVRVLRFDFDTRADADAMGARLVRASEAESLEARANRQGVSYRMDVSSHDDPAFYAAAVRAGAGGLAGPERGPDGWWVARVEALIPARPRGFDEARDDVTRQVLARRTEARLRATCDRLRARFGTRINDRAVAELGAEPR